MKLSIIIPVFNEEKTIEQIIRKVKRVRLSGISKEIIVVNDGSKDKTKKILLETSGIKLINHKNNLGKGAAVWTGIKVSTGDILIVQDADLEYDPNDFKKLIRPIFNRKTQVVYGSRISQEKLVLFGKTKTPLPIHFIANRFLSLLTRTLYASSITDMETCYKVFSRKSLKGIEIKSKGFDIEPEITAKILKKGLNIYEIPIKVTPRTYKEGKKITWKDGFIAVWTLVKYRFLD